LLTYPNERNLQIIYVTAMLFVKT